MRAFLLVNIGSPSNAGVKSVRKFLSQFLMDPYVIKLPYIIRYILVRLIIVPFRAKHSSQMYKRIATPKGFPLIINSEKIAKDLSVNLGAPTYSAMRYGEPSVKHKIQEAIENGATELTVLPLYPHYALSTWESSVQHVQKVVRRRYPDLKLDFKRPFFDNPGYLESLHDSIIQHGEVKYLIFSLHGLPLSHLPCGAKVAEECSFKKGVKVNSGTLPRCIASKEVGETCYKRQCIASIKAVMSSPQLKDLPYEVVFQSRLGRSKWLTPALSERIKELPNEGKRDVTIIAPSFIADCLETLYEIDIENRELFLASGGIKYSYIPTINEVHKSILA